MTLRMRFRHLRRRLGHDTSGVALLEFAFSLPLVAGVGLYAVEIGNLALMNLRISQVALNLADNASRVGGDAASSTTQQLREIDIVDVFDGIKRYGAGWDLTTRGRVTLSSLETTGNVQRIHWQRCIGLKSGAGYESSYGATVKADGVTYDPTAGVDTDPGTGDNSASHPGTLAPDGMGQTGSKVNAPNGSGVMFVEVNYEYKPIVSSHWLPGGSARIHYIASFVVRDNRDFGQLYNPSPAAPVMTCDKHTS